MFWNIERGQRLDDIKLLFTDREAFVRKVAEALQTSDVIVVNELDWGFP